MVCCAPLITLGSNPSTSILIKVHFSILMISSNRSICTSIVSISLYKATWFTVSKLDVNFNLPLVPPNPMFNNLTFWLRKLRFIFFINLLYVSGTGYIEIVSEPTSLDASKV